MADKSAQTAAPAPARLSYTIDEFAAATGLSRRFVYDELERGNLRSFKAGKRRMIPAQSATAYIEKGLADESQRQADKAA